MEPRGCRARPRSIGRSSLAFPGDDTRVPSGNYRTQYRSDSCHRSLDNPKEIGSDTQLSYVAGAPVFENLHRFLLYTLATSTWGWDTGRAITNVVAIVVFGPAVLLILRRAHRRAAFSAPVTFAPEG